ncbi:hypothetical protein [Pendulispora albinea]|uniref:Uncharacterized protein n=1 Tax=Pendulispora albinea TaxID=2741071 RepID=A0ABZ2LRM3_9BACT
MFGMPRVADVGIVAAALLVGAVIGGWLARARTAKRPSDADGEPDSEPDPHVPHASSRTGGARDPAKVTDANRTSDPFAAFPCRLGDVVLVHDGEEAWLESALVLSEEAPALILFAAPNAGEDRVILARRAPSGELLWLGASGALEWGPSEEPPSSLLHRGERYERIRRLPLAGEPLGPSPPAGGGNVLFAEYKSATDRRLVVLLRGDASASAGGSRAGGAGGKVLAWEGRVLGLGMYEVLPGGRD